MITVQYNNSNNKNDWHWLVKTSNYKTCVNSQSMGRRGTRTRCSEGGATRTRAACSWRSGGAPSGRPLAQRRPGQVKTARLQQVRLPRSVSPDRGAVQRVSQARAASASHSWHTVYADQCSTHSPASATFSGEGLWQGVRRDPQRGGAQQGAQRGLAQHARGGRAARRRVGHSLSVGQARSRQRGCSKCACHAQSVLTAGPCRG